MHSFEVSLGHESVDRTTFSIECILLKFHWGMKALTELHFQQCIETSKECIQFLITDAVKLVGQAKYPSI